MSLGSAVIDVTAEPHTGCRKFSDLRGINAKVVQSGTISVGNIARKR